MSFLINVAGITGKPCRKKIKLDLYLTPHTRINSTLIMKLNVKEKLYINKYIIGNNLINVEKYGEFLCKLSVGKRFLMLTQNLGVRKERIHQFDYINFFNGMVK